jgi:hypothetical protein
MRDMTSVKICDTSYPKQWLFNRKAHMHIKVSLLSEFKSHINLSKIETGRYSKPITPLENRICEKCFSDEIESEEHLLLKCSFYYTSRCKLFETIKNNINHLKIIVL